MHAPVQEAELVAAAATANPIHVQGREGTEDLDLDAVLRRPGGDMWVRTDRL
jgi:hypothetical protein